MRPAGVSGRYQRMQLNDLKLISASNIIRLRQGAGLTQAELGARLNYSDKTISKWERGEAIPDAFVLTQLAAMFDVTVDYLLSSHDQWEMQPAEPEEEAPVPEDDEDADPGRTYSAKTLIVLVIVSIWTAAVTAFSVLWIFDILFWRIFVFALPVSLLVHIILVSIFYPKKNLQFYITAFLASLFLSIYFIFPEKHIWQVFIILVPAAAVVFLACNLTKKPLRFRKYITKK